MPASKLGGFLLQWLKIDQARDIVKDPKRYPEFSETVVSDLRTSLDLFLEDVIGSEASDYRQLLRANYVYLNGRLAPLYGAKLAADAPFQKVLLEREERSRAAYASLLDGELCLYGHELADPSRGFHCSQRAGPGASAAAGGRRSPGSRPSSRPDNPPARDDSDSA